MTNDIVALLVFIMAAGYWIGSVLIKKSVLKAEKEFIPMYGTIINRVWCHGRYGYPLIEVYVNGEAIQKVDSTNGNLKSRDYPNGTRINVLYRKRKIPILGIEEEVRVNEGFGVKKTYSVIIMVFRLISMILICISAAIYLSGCANSEGGLRNPNEARQTDESKTSSEERQGVYTAMMDYLEEK